MVTFHALRFLMCYAPHNKAAKGEGIMKNQMNFGQSSNGYGKTQSLLSDEKIKTKKNQRLHKAANRSIAFMMAIALIMTIAVSGISIAYGTDVCGVCYL